MSRNVVGVIRMDEAYSKSVVLERLGVSQKFWDKMLSDGLPYAEVGHARWVSGRHLILHFEKHSIMKNSQAQ